LVFAQTTPATFFRDDRRDQFSALLADEDPASAVYAASFDQRTDSVRILAAEGASDPVALRLRGMLGRHGQLILGAK
jgi:hypothetical protein